MTENSIQKRASLHERTVQAVARGEVANPRAGRRQRTEGSGRVTVSQQHPALSLARTMGIPSSHVQIVGEPPFWEAIFWNHPAPWPGSESEHGTVPESWFNRGEWPRCVCGFDPHDNVALAAHYRENGFEEHAEQGQIKRRQVT